MGKCLSQIRPKKVSPLHEKRSASPIPADTEDNKRTEAGENEEEEEVSNAE